MTRTCRFLAIPAFLAALAPVALATQDVDAGQTDAPSPDEPRIRRHLALAAELEAEGAASEARLVLAELGCDASAAPVAPGVEKTTLAPRPHSAGSLLARGVVLFYRRFVGPAIGARCALEPSCSRYFLEASRRHGLLGLPMVADRFVREPVESASDRLVRRPDGSWRHSDPVSDHDWWFR